jgi:thiamine phosphate synthase YjbQ (UPF0047 family)
MPKKQLTGLLTYLILSFLSFFWKHANMVHVAFHDHMPRSLVSISEVAHISTGKSCLGEFQQLSPTDFVTSDSSLTFVLLLAGVWLNS